MKHQVILLVLALCFFLALTACGDAQTVPAASSTASPTATPSSAPSAVSSTPSQTAADTAPSDSTAAEETTEPDGADRNAALRGSWEGDVYTNPCFGLRINLPEGFLRYNDYQLAQSNFLLSETYLKTDAAELIQTNERLIVMTLVNYKDAAAHLVLYPAPQVMGGLTDEEIFSIMIGPSEGRDAGEPDPEILHLQVGGPERTVLHRISQQNGEEFDNYQLWFLDDEAFMGVLTIFTKKGADVRTILDEVSLFDPAA